VASRPPPGCLGIVDGWVAVTEAGGTTRCCAGSDAEYTLGCSGCHVQQLLPALDGRTRTWSTDGITEVREHSVVEAPASSTESDAIIYGTASTSPTRRLPDIRRTGRDLAAQWREHGIQTTSASPCTGSNLSSARSQYGLGTIGSVMIEAQGRYAPARDELPARSGSTPSRCASRRRRCSMTRSRALAGRVEHRGCTNCTWTPRRDRTLWPGRPAVLAGHPELEPSDFELVNAPAGRPGSPAPAVLGARDGSMKNFTRRVAVITGAVGDRPALALELAGRCARLALPTSTRSPWRHGRTAEKAARRPGAPLDVADRAPVTRTPTRWPPSSARQPVVNNAGVALMGTVEDMYENGLDGGRSTFSGAWCTAPRRSCRT